MRKDGQGIHDSYDYSDVVSYLIDEGFVNNEVSAEVFIEHMSDEWIESILEKFVSPFKTPPAHGRSNDSMGRLSPAMKALKKSDDLQKSEPGSPRQKAQTKRSKQLNNVYHAARNS
ncbi:hypothetical protein SCRM01_093c [Synechococcus phage S-CRM01]|uniref:hypothetical protein n=1 Tax=Synechococcus phage S-CRM01 TaxID=1026955 RepID=UPI000209E399|nr:hypothetical protein SCRM01_093c [Synechococcus phage S-CRM01]AEC53039.1 hypothetical protein SCRM01_093c [Synechococcus phage S-CRM01]